MNNAKVILVDHHNNILGEANKTEAHRKGLLHRAVSVIILNTKKELLLQQRAQHKYHSGLLWSNTCCTHPTIIENPVEAAKRCLYEEMGIKDIHLKYIFSFIYKTNVDNNMIEHEYDDVFLGETLATPIINLQEVANFRWVSLEALVNWVDQKPYEFTPWFLIIINNHLEKIKGFICDKQLNS
ncbi:MAG: isopentenyl-diphosphate Delta-isomerase [Ignavibacteria bacterium]